METQMYQLIKKSVGAGMYTSNCDEKMCCEALVSGKRRCWGHISCCILFVLSLIVSCILRQFAEKIPYAVLRVSLGSFLFFTILAILIAGVKIIKGPCTPDDPCYSLHHGGWMIKVICWLFLALLMFFLPNEIIIFYGAASEFGAGLFLFVQGVLLLDFVHRWNEKWVGYNEQFWFIALFVVALICYMATCFFSLLLLNWFTPSKQDYCGLNVFFIVTTLYFAPVFLKVALHPTVNESILSGSVVSFYCMYVCFSGLASEPQDYRCNGLHKHSQAVSTTLLTFGLLTTVLSSVYSVVHARSSTTLLSHPSSPHAGNGRPILPLEKSGEEMNIIFFHTILSLASMYSAMLLTGWSASVGETGKLIDVGWPSVWVRIITGWAIAGFYIWSIVAPHLGSMYDVCGGARILVESFQDV